MAQIGSPAGLTAFQLLTPTRATAETTTLAGVDLKDYIDDILLILSVQRPNASAACSLAMSFKDSTDNSTFTAVTAPTFAYVTTATSTTATVSINTRAIARYLQASYIAVGTTGTFDASVVGVGLKQMV